MKRSPAVLLALALAMTGTTALCAADAGGLIAGAAGIEGRVFGASSSLPGARIWAYGLADLTLSRAIAGDDGTFAFAGLPAGLYRFIAHKPGFLPVIVMVTRASAEARQFVELQLAAAPKRDGEAADFWSLRDQVPSDVLREIEMAGPLIAAATEPGHNASNFQTEFAAMTGVDRQPAAAAYLSRGSVGVAGQMGGMHVDILGDFWALDSSSFANSNHNLAQGTASSLSLSLDNENDSVRVTSLNNRLAVTEGHEAPVEMEHYRVSWSRPVGERGRSNVAAQYTSESNFYRWGFVNSAVLPDSSRTLRVDGSYATTFGRSNLETGVRFRQRHGDFVVRPTSLASTVPEETVSVFGRGSFEASPALLLEYGLYTRLQDGAVSLMPRGGVVVQMGPRWQATATMAQRLDPQPTTSFAVDFTPVFFGDQEAGELVEDYRYGLTVTRTLGENDAVSLSAIDRRYGQSMWLYFSQQFFDHLENVYLVLGDRLPELQFSISKRLTSRIQTRLDSSYAAGGGGIVQATTKNSQFENDVEYLVTSIDTHFEPSATGVFVALHRVEQALTPILFGRRGTAPRQVAIESLELAVTQDLNVLLDLAADWAIQVSMELSRGEVPDAPFTADEVRSRILGGVAVTF